MKILMFDIENNKAIKSFVYKPDGGAMVVAGSTGEGKTTAASALWGILNKSQDCLTHGENTGHITVSLGEDGPELIATRAFTAKTNTVSLVRMDGKPTSMADFKKMVLTLSENPHKIMDMKPTEQVATLLAAADVGDCDIGKMDADITLAEDNRLELHRKMEANEPGEEPPKVDAVDVEALLVERGEDDEHNRNIQAAKSDLENIKIRAEQQTNNKADEEAEIVQIDADLAMEVERLQLQAGDKKTNCAVLIAKADDHLKVLREEYNAANTLAKNELHDTSDVDAKMAAAHKDNAQAAAHVAWQAQHDKHHAIKTEWVAADDKIAKARLTKKNMLDGAKWPIEGLSIEDGVVYYNDNRLDNLGTSEQMLVCSALAIKNILAHPIKVVRLDGIESMSKADFKSLQKLFGDAGIQVLATRVSRGGVEEGEIVITEATE